MDARPLRGVVQGVKCTDGAAVTTTVLNQAYGEQAPPGGSLRQTDKFLFLSGWLLHRMCGEYVDSAAAQVGYVPFDYKRGRWAAAHDWKWHALPVRPSMLPELVDEGRRILVFSQFTSMLSLIGDALQKQGIEYVKLTGQTQKRDDVIQRFQSGEVPIFLISLKAGGVGLNLTAADTVIHYDPWWNPAAEEQASDRAWRIGQDKPVFVYKLIMNQSIEEKILLMQKNKAQLAQSILSKNSQINAAFSEDELLQLFDAT